MLAKLSHNESYIRDQKKKAAEKQRRSQNALEANQQQEDFEAGLEGNDDALATLETVPEEGTPL